MGHFTSLCSFGNNIYGGLNSGIGRSLKRAVSRWVFEQKGFGMEVSAK